MENFAKYYALKDYEKEVEIINQPINLEFCENIEIKYDFKYNYFKNILENYVCLANELISAKRKLNNTLQLNENTLLTLKKDYDIIRDSNLFDKEWYIEKYKPQNNIDPITHYLFTWKENMNDPAEFFSTEFYYKTHTDVTRAGINPFVHYIRFGRKEKRKIMPSKN